MKIRNGFISNSSSSSFIVAFPKIPESVKETKQIVFGERRTIKFPWEETSSYTTEEAARRIFKDISTREPLTTESQVAKILSYGEYENSLDYDFFRYSKDNPAIDWNAYHKAREDSDLKYARQFIKDNEDLVFFEFTYSDSTEGESILEHGDIFKNLPHIKINCH